MEFHSPAQHLAAEVAAFALQPFGVVCPGASINIFAWATYNPVPVYGKGCQTYPLKVIVISFVSNTPPINVEMCFACCCCSQAGSKQ